MQDPVQKVRDALDNAGANDIEIRVVESTIFTVDDAAKTIGVNPGEILKSLILVLDKKQACLILMSGSNQVDSKKAALELGAKRSRMMPPDEVFERYGFRIGGVPSVGYDEILPTLLDEDLFKYEIVWSAAGTDHAFFPIQPQRLLEITHGKKAAIKKISSPCIFPKTVKLRSIL